MDYNYILCACATRRGNFISQPGPSSYLKVPRKELPKPMHAIPKNRWIKEMISAATWGENSGHQTPGRGDLLVFVHGYNNGPEIVRDRHEQLQDDLKGSGFKGALLTFWWPSKDRATAYLPDRHVAKRTAMQLVSDGIKIISAYQSVDCSVNIHVLGHSTGAYVIREAFDDADDTELPNNAWSVSQIVFIAGDVSSRSMREENSSTESLYRHCYRLTNYYSRYDRVLKLSNKKRIGTAPRVGRVGLPDNAPHKAVDVDCSEYYKILDSDESIKMIDQPNGFIGNEEHSWHIGNKVFAADLFHTLVGDLDRMAIPTRKVSDGGRLELVRGRNT